jgi:hypothetical protein
LDEHRRVIQAANKGSSWELKVWPVTLHAASRLAARNDGDKGYRAFGQAENGDLIEMSMFSIRLFGFQQSNVNTQPLFC